MATGGDTTDHGSHARLRPSPLHERPGQRAYVGAYRRLVAKEVTMLGAVVGSVPPRQRIITSEEDFELPKAS